MAEKPSKAQGFVTFRKDRKKWSVRYPEYNPETGKNVLKAKDFKTQDEAIKYLASINYQKENPLYIEHNGIPFCELMKANERLKLKTNQITEVTYHRNLQIINQIEKFPIGKERIDEITSDELQAFMNAHTHLSNSSINKLYQQLGTTFKSAINRGYMLRNPMVNVLKPKSEKIDKPVRALTFREQQAFTNYLMNKDISDCRYKNVYLIQMFMGLRVSEALALSLQDIDLEERRAYIRRTLSKDELGHTIMGKTTKTYAGRRIVPIPKFIVEPLIEQMQYANNQINNEEKLLFKPDYMKYTSRENVNTELKRLLKRHFGIEDITTHSLRHTFGTRCIESGMQPVVVQKLMGHTDISVTLNTYTSVYDDFKAKEIEKVNKYYLNNRMLEDPELLEEAKSFEEFEEKTEDGNQR